MDQSDLIQLTNVIKTTIASESNISWSILFGVLTGVLTSVLIWLCIKIKNKIIIPWYQSLVYEGINIDDEWLGYDSKDEDDKEEALDKEVKTEEIREDKKPSSSIIIRQQGHNISGEMTLLRQPTGKIVRKVFKFDGVFRDNNLIVKLVPEDRKRLGMGSYVMRLVEDGNKLDGVGLFVSAANGEIFTIRGYWTRQ